MSAHKPSGGIFDYDHKKERLTEVEMELGESAVWDNPERAQALGRERSSLEIVVKTIEALEKHAEGDFPAVVLELIDLAKDPEGAEEVPAPPSDGSSPSTGNAAAAGWIVPRMSPAEPWKVAEPKLKIPPSAAAR